MAKSLPFHPDSRTWLINRERLVLLGGAGAAVLQVAHPAVAKGVARHSNFRSDSTGRLRRTLDAVYAIAFGTSEEIAQTRAQVAAAHKAVRGPGYSAFDPDAQLWVMATLIMGSVTMFQRFIRPLERHELNDFLAENVAFAEVFGLPPDRLPTDWSEFESYWEMTIHSALLGSDPVCAEVANAVVQPERPMHMRMLSPVFHALAIEFIPPALQIKLHLEGAALHPVLWKVLDSVLPSVIPRLPPQFRFAPAYLKAHRAISECGGFG